MPNHNTTDGRHRRLFKTQRPCAPVRLGLLLLALAALVPLSTGCQSDPPAAQGLTQQRCQRQADCSVGEFCAVTAFGTDCLPAQELTAGWLGEPCQEDQECPDALICQDQRCDFRACQSHKDCQNPTALCDDGRCKTLADLEEPQRGLLCDAQAQTCFGTLLCDPTTSTCQRPECRTAALDCQHLQEVIDEFGLGARPACIDGFCDLTSGSPAGG